MLQLSWISMTRRREKKDCECGKSRKAEPDMERGMTYYGMLKINLV